MIKENELVELEKMVWDALVSGDRVADGLLLADDFLGVYETGFAGKENHVEQLINGPTIRHYELSDFTRKVLCSDTVLLSYKAEYSRPASDELEVMYVSSIWQRQTGQRQTEKWLNIFSQDTPEKT